MKMMTAVVAVVLGMALICLAQSRPAQPPPSPAYPSKREWGTVVYPPQADTFRRLRPQAPSWTAWWEANRDVYLAVMGQEGAQNADPEGETKYRKRAIESLLAALKSDLPALRCSAALAMGQIADEAALEPLAELAKKDKEVQVRQAAIIAIGLMDIAKGEQILAAAAFKPLPQFENGFVDKPSDRQAALMALGLMSHLGPETIVNIQRMGAQLPMMTPTSAWALTRPLDPADPSAPKIAHWDTSRIHDRESLADQGEEECPGRQSLVDGSRLAASAISIAAMSRTTDPAVPKLLQEAMTKTNMPWIASEAMLSLGSRGDVGSAAAFCEILLATPAGKALPVYKMLKDQNGRLESLWRACQADEVRKDFRDVEKTGYRDTLGVIREGHRDYLQAFYLVFWNQAPKGGVRDPLRDAMPKMRAVTPLRARYLQLHCGGDDYSAFLTGVAAPGPLRKITVYDFGWLRTSFIIGEPGADRVGRVNSGVEPICMADLRASAAIALGRIDGPASRQALRKVLAEKDDEYSDIYKSMAIMSLGQLGDSDALPALAELVHPTAPHGVAISKKRLVSPLRGFAALALGLYARPVKTPQGPEDRKDFDKVYLLLAERVADRDEPEDVRAACSLALGLTGRTENLKYLQPASKTVDARNGLLAGYMILARGMLGDKTILEPAKTFLAAGNNKTDRNGILARRAAVLGLGLTGSQEVLPVLEKCWGMNYHVDRETALAMSFCQGFNATDRLVAAMKNSAKPDDKAMAARSLGELFMKERPSRLARLTNGSNYAMRIPRLIFYRTLANEFLYSYLLAPAADEWEILDLNKAPLAAGSERLGHAPTDATAGRSP